MGVRRRAILSVLALAAAGGAYEVLGGNLFRQQLRSTMVKLYRWFDRAPRLTVATFHRIGDKSRITPAHVRHHMEYLARYNDVVLPSTFASLGVPKGAAMVTVDDCHQDIYWHLFPVAQALRIPFTICVPTDSFFRRHWLWFDQFYWMLERAPADAEVEAGGQRLRVGSAESVASMKSFLKRRLPAERDRLLASMGQQLKCVPPPAPQDGYESATQEQMKEMLASGLVEICAHSVTHTIATVLPDDTLRDELRRSKEELERFCEREVVCFCYPNGEDGDFDARTTEAVKGMRHKLALTSVEGTNPFPFDPYLVRRVHAHEVVSVFEKEASGLGDLQQRLKSWVSPAKVG